MRATLCWLLLAVSHSGVAAEEEEGALTVSEARRLGTFGEPNPAGAQALAHGGQDCFNNCWKQPGFCSFCGGGNACCEHYEPVQPWVQDVKTALFGGHDMGGSNLVPMECRGSHITFVRGGPQWQCVKAAYLPGNELNQQFLTPHPERAWISPAQCIGYMAKEGCQWTHKNNCPTQPAGADGRAWNDGSIGYRCCCGLQLWMKDVSAYTQPTRDERAQCRPYMMQKGCGWTQAFNCPGGPPGTNMEAVNDGSLGFKCCCVFGFWRAYDQMVGVGSAAGTYSTHEIGVNGGPKLTGGQADELLDSGSGSGNVIKSTFSQAVGANFLPTQHHGPILDASSTNTHGACQFGICTDLDNKKSATPYKDATDAAVSQACICKTMWVSAVPGCEGAHHGCTPACGDTKPRSWCEVDNVGCKGQVAGHFGDAWAWCTLPGEETTIAPFTTTTTSPLSCGGHDALTCADCGDARPFCNGDCTWVDNGDGVDEKDGTCVLKAAPNVTVTAPVAPGTTVPAVGDDTAGTTAPVLAGTTMPADADVGTTAAGTTAPEDAGRRLMVTFAPIIPDPTTAAPTVKAATVAPTSAAAPTSVKPIIILPSTTAGTTAPANNTASIESSGEGQSSESSGKSSGNPVMLGLISLVVGLCLICVAVALCCKRPRKKRATERESYMKNDFIERYPMVDETEAEPLTQSQVNLMPALESLPPPPPPQELELPGLMVPPLMAQAVPTTTVYEVMPTQAMSYAQPQTVVYQQPSIYQQAATPTYETYYTTAPAGTSMYTGSVYAYQ